MSTGTDIIIYWVDGGDPEWTAKRERYATTDPDHRNPSRFRDWELLKYLFRGIDKFAPWAGNVFFVSDGQIPEWLDTAAPRLKIIDHKDYIPEEYLPVFSANPIELNFHRIEGLSEQFVVFNDDMFLTAETQEDMFFRDGMPVDILMEYPIMCSGRDPVFSHILCNDFNTLGKHFKRSEYKKRLRSKILSPKYGKYFFYNLMSRITPFPNLYGFLTPHFPRPYLRSSYEEVWAAEGDLLDKTCRNRFRSGEDVNMYLIRLWNMLKGNFVPGNIFKHGRAFFISEEKDVADMESALAKKDYRMICINDECSDQVFEKVKDRVIAVMEGILPDMSSFEKKEDKDA